MPASVTYATADRTARPRRRPCAPRRSLCACTARRRPPAGTPACVSSARARRVSSAAITSASRSASTARGERSPRFPIGVATSTSAPAAGAPSHALVHSAQLDRSPGWSLHRSNAPAARLDRERGAPHDAARGDAGRSVHVRSTTPSRSQKATSIGNRMPNVCTCRHGRSTSTPSTASRPSRPRRRARVRRAPPRRSRARHRHARATSPSLRSGVTR